MLEKEGQRPLCVTSCPSVSFSLKEIAVPLKSALEISPFGCETGSPGSPGRAGAAYSF